MSGDDDRHDEWEPENRCDIVLPKPSYGLPQMPRAADNGSFRGDLAEVLNRHSRENGSNTPDHILAQYLANCLDAYDVAIGTRAQWYGRVDSIGGPLIVPTPKSDT